MNRGFHGGPCRSTLINFAKLEVSEPLALRPNLALQLTSQLHNANMIKLKVAPKLAHYEMAWSGLALL